MKAIKPQDIPSVLTDEVIDILAEMSIVFPVTEEWRQVSKVLSIEQRIQVNNRVSEIKRKIGEQTKAKMTAQEKLEEGKKWKKIKDDIDSYKFYGNMGQPETPEEFKDRYGVWPPGYDENGNKLTDSDEKN